MERTVARPMSLQNFMSTHSSKDGDGFIETARLIAGEAPPRWLMNYLQGWSPSVMVDGVVHAMQLGKAEARSRLRKLSEAAELIMLARWPRIRIEKCRSLHDLPRLAVPTLRDLLRNPCNLKRMISIRRQAFDRGDILFRNIFQKRLTGTNSFALDMHSARPTLRYTAAELRSR
jgi:hypothetical protein